MRKKALWVAGVLAALAACNSLPYKDDVGFLVSAQANSPEFPIYVNGRLCADMEGVVGLCSKRVKSDEDVTFRFDPQNYPYLLSVSCSAGVAVPPGATVPQGVPYTFTLKAGDFAQFRAFTCIGEVSPQDRSPPISAKFRVQLVVLDAAYAAREGMFFTKEKDQNFLVLGQFARNAWVLDDGKWKQYSKSTSIRIFGEPAKVKAYSESYAMRFNYLNMGVADIGVDQH